MDKKIRLKKKLIPAAMVIPVIAILCAAWFIYVGNYYHALADAEIIAGNVLCEDISNGVKEVEINTNEDGSITFYPVNTNEKNSGEIPTAGIIFYPGAKVEYTSYSPLMYSLAERGYVCILMKMPQNMAILDINAADGITQKYPEVEHWYMAGHSMGGAMAATYIKKHADSFDGLILLAAFSSSDLSDTNLQVLSIYGSEDEVLNRKTYEKCKKNLPGEDSTVGSTEDSSVGSTEEYVIEGGCHAYFGMYGAQRGDGTPTISNEEQIEITTDVISEWIDNIDKQGGK